MKWQSTRTIRVPGGDDRMEIIVNIEIQSGDDAIRLLSKVFSTEKSAEEKKAVLSEEFHIEVTEEISREVSQVCNLSTGIYDKGIQKGKREGIQEGRREGVLEVLFGLEKTTCFPLRMRQSGRT